MRGKRLSDLIIPPELRGAHETGLAHYLATGEGPVIGTRIEVPALHRDGHQIPVELSITASEQFGGKLFIGFIRDISDRKEEAERQQRILQESEHRVKNMLTVVQAIALQTAANSADMDSFTASFSGRLESLARAHQLLVGQVWHDVAISALADRVLGAEVVAGRARFGGPELLLKAGQVLGLSMILHELYTNAIKYGALCSDEGQIEVDWSVDERRDRARLARDRYAVRNPRGGEQRLWPADDRDEREVRPQWHDRARLAQRRADRDVALPRLSYASGSFCFASPQPASVVDAARSSSKSASRIE